MWVESIVCNISVVFWDTVYIRSQAIVNNCRLTVVTLRTVNTRIIICHFIRTAPKFYVITYTSLTIRYTSARIAHAAKF